MYRVGSPGMDDFATRQRQMDQADDTEIRQQLVGDAPRLRRQRAHALEITSPELAQPLARHVGNDLGKRHRGAGSAAQAVAACPKFGNSPAPNTSGGSPGSARSALTPSAACRR